MARRAEAQTTRFAELQQLKRADWQPLHTALHSAPLRLPKGAQHFADHRGEFEDLGIETVEAYQELFQLHIQRTTLR